MPFEDRFMVFKESGTGAEVAINPVRVRCIRPHSPGVVRIEFDEKHIVLVEGDAQRVASHLEK